MAKAREDRSSRLAQFLGWAFTGRVVPFSPRIRAREGWATNWTAPRYIRAFDDGLEHR